jgi:CelD/BcsL family acetyltransferase involved in cellulose biosynthesis
MGGKESLFRLSVGAKATLPSDATVAWYPLMSASELSSGAGRLVLHEGIDAFDGLAPEWEALETLYASPFLTHAWLRSWWGAFGTGTPVTAVLRGHDGRLRAAALLQRDRLGGLSASANDHSGDWDAVAVDDDARRAFFAGLAAEGERRLVLGPMRSGSPGLLAAWAGVHAAGMRAVAEEGPRSPYLALPRSFDELMGGLSRNLRSQVGRRHRALQREGSLSFRVTTGGEHLGADLDAFLAVEASGWKAAAGTAILREDGAEGLYRSFAGATATQGRLRLSLLELDGHPIAGDLGVVIGAEAFLVKTAFDENWGRLSPGLVLRAEVLRESIEEGLTGYDFLGPDDAYKLRWTSLVRPRVTLHAFGGALAVPGAAWRRLARPTLKRLRRVASAPVAALAALA